VSNEFFFGTGFLDYVDSLFFYLPFSSRGQAEKARAPSGTTDQEWAKLRTGLLQDHRNPENRPILIQAWKNYVATTFAQPAAGRPPGPRASVTTVYVIGWMMTILRFQLHLLHVLQLIRVPGQLEDTTAARRAEAVVKGTFFH
jgi:hypothetical protein